MNHVKLLKNLGDSSHEIYISLINDNIKGRQCSANNCPIAHYLQKHGYPQASTGVSQYHLSQDKNPERYDTWECLQQFIVDFDKGIYPDLVEN